VAERVARIEGLHFSCAVQQDQRLFRSEVAGAVLAGQPAAQNKGCRMLVRCKLPDRHTDGGWITWIGLEASFTGASY
jgi:hypothetical protein